MLDWGAPDGIRELPAWNEEAALRTMESCRSAQRCCRYLRPVCIWAMTYKQATTPTWRCCERLDARYPQPMLDPPCDRPSAAPWPFQLSSCALRGFSPS
jgi:hypothetical protein